MEDVRAVVISSRGGVHEGQQTDAVTPYLRSVLGLMGINDVEFIYAEGMDIKPTDAIPASLMPGSVWNRLHCRHKTPIYLRGGNA